MFRFGRHHSANTRPARRVAAVLWVFAILILAAGAAVLLDGRDPSPPASRRPPFTACAHHRRGTTCPASGPSWSLPTTTPATR